MFGLFKKKDKKEEVVKDIAIYAVADGDLISIENVNDLVFAQKMMGDGYAVIPTDGDIYSPVEGKVLSVFPTKHAIGIQMASGIEILIHMGLDTVELNGKPFETFVSEGDTLTADTLVAKCDLAALAEAGKDNAMVVVITNMDKVKEFVLDEHADVQAKQAVGSVQHL